VITLEPQVAGHAAALFELLHQPGVYDFLDHEPPESIGGLAERLARLESRRSPDGTQQWLNWVVVRYGEVLGYVQATVRGERAEVAYVIGSRFWGGGVASAATTMMLDDLAANYGVRIATATVETANERSIRLLRRLGFEQTAQRGSELAFERLL
jgi:ribosomal-protein-alanine N-acetyltransferase